GRGVHHPAHRPGCPRPAAGSGGRRARDALGHRGRRVAMRNDLTALETALELRSRGRVPVPLWPLGAMIPTTDGGKRSKGKEPILGSEWDDKALELSEADLHDVYRKHPGAGVGILLGPRGGVIDLEGDGHEAEDSLLELIGGERLETLGWSSRRG